MKNYQTQSLYEASFLLASGFKIISKNTNGQKTSLVFLDTPDLQTAIMSFYNGSGTVSAKAYVDQFRSLKDFIFTR